MEVWNPQTRVWEELPNMTTDIYENSPDLPDGAAERLGLDESNGLYGYVLDEATLDKLGDD